MYFRRHFLKTLVMLQKQKAHYTNKSKEIAEKTFDKF
jgi:hypothetical protein